MADSFFNVFKGEDSAPKSSLRTAFLPLPAVYGFSLMFQGLLIPFTYLFCAILRRFSAFPTKKRLDKDLEICYTYFCRAAAA